MNATYTAYVSSDLYNAGRTEDGHAFIAEVFYVVMEDASGRRFRHEASFAGTQCVVDKEEGYAHFPDLRQEATAKAERLVVRVNASLKAGKGVDMDLWAEVDPAYGSDAYIGQGTEAKRAFADRSAA